MKVKNKPWHSLNYTPNREESLKAMFKYEIKELESQLIFYSDSESPIPAPMMLFIVGDAFEKYVSQQ